jgi:D-serine dehydratase
MQRINYVEVTGGWNVLIGGISEIIAEFTFKDAMDVGRLLMNEDYRRITQKLRTEFAMNYTSRVMKSTERFDEPRWFK